MATHSSILAWRIPWTEEPGGLQFIGLHRAGHKWSDSARIPAKPPECPTKLGIKITKYPHLGSSKQSSIIWGSQLFYAGECLLNTYYIAIKEGFLIHSFSIMSSPGRWQPTSSFVSVCTKMLSGYLFILQVLVVCILCTKACNTWWK